MYITLINSMIKMTSLLLVMLTAQIKFYLHTMTMDLISFTIKLLLDFKSVMSYNILNELDNSYKKQAENGMKATVNLRYNPTDWLFFVV